MRLRLQTPATSLKGQMMRLQHIRFVFDKCSQVPSALSFAVFLFALLITVEGSAQEPLNYHGFDDESRSLESKEGLAEILSGKGFYVGFPLQAKMALDKSQASSNTKKPDSTTSLNGWYYLTDQIPSPPSRRSDLTLGVSSIVRNNVKLVNSNCFQCHAGIVNGNVVAGLGNNRLIPMKSGQKLTDSPTLQQLQSLVKTEAEKGELADFDAASRIYLNLPATASLGDNFSPFVVWSYGAHLENPAKSGLKVSNAKTELVKLMESTMVPNVDPMPWWLMKYKTKNYWYSDGGIYDAAHFSFNFTTPHAAVNANHAKHVESTEKNLAFARETVSPKFPKSLDDKLVKTGADLFHGRSKPQDRTGFKTCAKCHGTYTKKQSQLDLSRPGSWTVNYNGSEHLENVGTDEEYNKTLRKLKPIADHINKLSTYYDAQGTPDLTPRFSMPDGNGYVAPPLVGVWASAPYFHNGSVPTIEAVLNSKKRPAIWLRQLRDPHAYNLQQVGLKFKPLTRQEFEKSAKNKSTDHHAIYDTQTFGHKNAGHPFGDRLTVEERAALIEFLKSLSGPDMPAIQS
jgi:hypothetical protein